MDNMIAKIAKNDEFKTVGVSVFANDEEVFSKGVSVTPEFYYVKNVRLDVETYTEIIRLSAEIDILARAENTFFHAFKESTLEVLNKAAKKANDDSICSFDLSVYRKSREEKEARLNKIIENLK